MKSIATNSALNECVDTFKRMNATADEVKKSRETLFLYLYWTKTKKFIFYVLGYTQFQIPDVFVKTT